MPGQPGWRFFFQRFFFSTSFVDRPTTGLVPSPSDQGQNWERSPSGPGVVWCLLDFFSASWPRFSPPSQLPPEPLISVFVEIGLPSIYTSPHSPPRFYRATKLLQFSPTRPFSLKYKLVIETPEKVHNFFPNQVPPPRFSFPGKEVRMTIGIVNLGFPSGFPPPFPLTCFFFFFFPTTFFSHARPPTFGSFQVRGK